MAEQLITIIPTESTWLGINGVQTRLVKGEDTRVTSTMFEQIKDFGIGYERKLVDVELT